MTIHHDAAPPPTVLRCALDLVARNPDPVSAFIYDLPGLRRHVRQLHGALPPGVELYYAIKANSEPAILRTVAPLVDGFEISSGGEIDAVLDCPTRRNFIFSGPGKLDSELRRALRYGVEMIHLESLAEIRRLDALAAELGIRQRVLLRINPLLPDQMSSRLAMAGKPTPFGIDERQLPQAVQQVEESSSLILSGFHIHALSHQGDVDRHLQLLTYYLRKWPEWAARARDPASLTLLNVGGGIGVDYVRGARFDWPSLCRQLEDLLAGIERPPRLRFELGRFVTAFCGYYVMQILDLKDSHGERFAVCRGGTHQFRLPAAQAHNHPVIHVPLHEGRRDGDPLPFTIVGQLCTPKDVLARHAPLVDPLAGDLLLLPFAGAYGFNISHADFLCHPRPDLIFLDDDAAPAKECL